MKRGAFIDSGADRNKPSGGRTGQDDSESGYYGNKPAIVGPRAQLTKSSIASRRSGVTG